MSEIMTFPKTFDEFAEQYKIVDEKQVYTNGTELIPIFRVKQWLENTEAEKEALINGQETLQKYIAEQKAEIEKLQELVEQYAKEVFHQEAEAHTRRLLKIFCLSMNELRGHGKTRLEEDLATITQISNEHMDDEVFWHHADKRLEQIGIPFKPEDYEKMEVK